VTTKPGHREELEGNRKNIAQGMPVVTGKPVALPVHFLHKPRVHRTPGIPRALLHLGSRCALDLGNEIANSGAACRENDDPHLVVPANAGTHTARSLI
jgi:hypothetical protein